MPSDISIIRLRADDPNAEIVAGWTFKAYILVSHKNRLLNV